MHRNTLMMPVELAAVMLTGLTVTATADPPMYTVTTLQDPPSISTAQPSAINAQGHAVGSIFNTATGFFDGAFWDRDGSATVLSTAYDLDIAEALGIRDDGTILSAAVLNANIEVQHAALLAADGAVTFLPSLAGDNGVVSVAFDMNDAGIVVGRSATVATPFWMSVPNDAVFWVDDEITSIGTLGGFLGTALRINNNNIIIGQSNTAISDLPRGFVWTEDDGMQEIPPIDIGEVGHVRDINDSNVIVGVGTLDSDSHATMWTDYTKVPVRLPVLRGDGDSVANAINNAGYIVGSASTAQGSRARLWIDDEKVYDLNDLLAEPLGFPIGAASAITDNGLILAHGSDPRAGTVDIVLRPVITGDLNGDGSVDVLDLLALLAAWGACEDCPADLNEDGLVDVLDMLMLLNAWG